MSRKGKSSKKKSRRHVSVGGAADSAADSAADIAAARPAASPAASDGELSTKPTSQDKIQNHLEMLFNEINQDEELKSLVREITTSIDVKKNNLANKNRDVILNFLVSEFQKVKTQFVTIVKKIIVIIITNNLNYNKVINLPQDFAQKLTSEERVFAQKLDVHGWEPLHSYISSLSGGSMKTKGGSSMKRKGGSSMKRKGGGSSKQKRGRLSKQKTRSNKRKIQKGGVDLSDAEMDVLLSLGTASIVTATAYIINSLIPSSKVTINVNNELEINPDTSSENVYSFENFIKYLQFFVAGIIHQEDNNLASFANIINTFSDLINEEKLK